MSQNASTNHKSDRVSILGKIAASTKLLGDADLIRLENFARSLVEQKRGKRGKRRSDLVDRKPVDDSWRIGG